MKRVIVLTGSELRHEFLRLRLASATGFTLVASYCEGLEGTLKERVASQQAESDPQVRHLQAREQSENDFFGAYVRSRTDTVPTIRLPKGRINDPEHVQAIIDARPDVLVAYGCSLIRSSLLDVFQGRFVNLHLGLSPYYRGSGTNFWPLVNGEPEYVGATFMHIDAGVDTGEIIHQLRARVSWGDTPAQIGNRLIADASAALISLVSNFDRLAQMPQPEIPADVRVYRKKNFTDASVIDLYRRFREGLVDTYLDTCEARCRHVPILRNPAVVDVE